MNMKLKAGLGLFALILTTQAMAQITFYQGEGFRGRAFATEKNVNNLARKGFNDFASSVVVDRGRWEVCEDANFKGNCVLLRQGSYDSLRSMGMNNRISSVRAAKRHRNYANEAPSPIAAPSYEYRQRPNERTFQAPVTSVRAVMGPPEERCWIEHQQVNEPGRTNSNVGGTVIGALVGGVLGHQVGGGRGKDLATAGGAVAGALVGSNVGRKNDNGNTYDREVRRCENVASDKPAYWEVTYNFRGEEHRLQMTAPPGSSISVNRNGEPRQ